MRLTKNEWQETWEKINGLVILYGEQIDPIKKIEISQEIIKILHPAICYWQHTIWGTGYRYEQNPDKYVSLAMQQTIIPHSEAVFTSKDLYNELICFIMEKIIPRYKDNTFKNSFEIWFGYNMKFFVPSEIKGLKNRLMMKNWLDLEELPRKDSYFSDYKKFNKFKFYLQEYSNIKDKSLALRVIRHICFSPIDSVFYRGRFSAKRLKANYLPDFSIKIIEDLLDKLGENKELVEYCREGCSKKTPAEQKNTNIDYYKDSGNYVSKVDIQTELWARGKL